MFVFFHFRNGSSKEPGRTFGAKSPTAMPNYQRHKKENNKAADFRLEILNLKSILHSIVNRVNVI